jgi:hypothetical protein
MRHYINVSTIQVAFVDGARGVRFEYHKFCKIFSVSLTQ